MIRGNTVRAPARLSLSVQRYGVGIIPQIVKRPLGTANAHSTGFQR
ncbi:protein of unknown function [Paraburkholderia dioscoreae]|uniref:Uncharacterized protein n=1 Tax=Paraburkholderia dioscoreae TaxID=2604047 RepID=A0A5Q4Z2A1_9BURK|nr:protein of unknown function [Paraburkholderia dioscoreae]